MTDKRAGTNVLRLITFHIAIEVSSDNNIIFKYLAFFHPVRPSSTILSFNNAYDDL